MDENRNPFDSTQSNSNPSEPQQTDSHTTPSTERPQQGAAGQSESVYYQSGQEYRNTEQNQQERSSDIPPYQWNSSYQVIPMGSNILTEQDSRILGTKMIMAVHFPIGTGSIGKMEQDFSLLLPDGLLRNPNKR